MKQFNYEITLPKIIQYTLFASVLFLAVYGINYQISIWLAHWLGAESFGDFSAARSTISFCASLVLLGYDSAILNFIPQYLAKKDLNRVYGYLRYGVTIILIIATAIIFISTLLNIFAIPALRLHPIHIPKLPFISYHPVFSVLWIVPIYGINIYISKLLRSINHIFSSLLLLQLGSPFLLAAGMFTLKFFHGIDVNLGLYIFGWSSLLLLLIQLCMAFLYLPHKIFLTQPIYEKAAWLHTALELLSSSLLMTICFSSSIIILEIFGYNEGTVGIYAAVFTITSIYLLFPQMTGQIFVPMLRTAINAGRYRKIWILLSSSIVTNLIVIATISLILYHLRHMLLNHFGPIFGSQQGQQVFNIALLTYIISMPFYPLWPAIQYSNERKTMLYILGIIAAIYLVSSITLVIYYDMLGAAIGLLISQILGTLAMIFLAFKAFPISISKPCK